MLCNECGGDGWKTIASTEGVFTLICKVCDGTGVAYPESSDTPTNDQASDAFWDDLQMALTERINQSVLSVTTR